RLSLCLLSKFVDKSNISTFTFGYHEKILEYKFAKKTTEILGLNKPEFYKLSDRSYLDSFDLPYETGGAIAIHHSHIYDYLKKKDTNSLFISNYYSDAVMGWNAKYLEKEDCLENTDYCRSLLNNQFHLPEDMINSIKADLKKIISRYPKDSNFSCMDEFIYVTERNPKFHVKLTFAYNKYIKTELPYADYNLLVKMISIPLQFRYEKKLEAYLIENKYFRLHDVSSRRCFQRSQVKKTDYSVSERIYYSSSFFVFRLINLINYILAKVLKVNLQIINPYLTENQEIIFNRSFKLFNKKACEYFYSRGIINGILKEQLLKIEYKCNIISAKYTLVSLWSILTRKEEELEQTR
ncbi:MAG: hypothetical protein AAGU01_01995, partial [Clostridiaceae bacterium]